MVAGAEADDGQQREAAIGAGFAQPNAEAGRQVLADALIAHDPARNAVAYQNDVFTHGPAEDQIVKRRDAIELVSRHLQKLGNVPESFVGDPAPMSLDDLHGLNTHSPLVRIMRELRFDLASLFLSEHKSCSHQRSTSASK